MSSSSNTPPEGYFNDLSQPTGLDRLNKNKSPPSDRNSVDTGDTNISKLKRIACIICRKRKLKCDGTKPSCSTCTRLGHNCAYDEVRRKSGPKRGYVKALEERLKQVETLLKTQDPAAPAVPSAASPIEANPTDFSSTTATFNPTGPDLASGSAGTLNNLAVPHIGIGNAGGNDNWAFNGESPQPPVNLDYTGDINMSMGIDDNTFTWEMIGLGLEEPLPPQDSIDELHQIFFDKVHPSLPMIHKYRYLAAMNLAPSQRPPVCLRYAMWTLAASVTDKYMDLKDHFYHRSRKYVESDYLKGHGEHMISIAHAQTHCLLASYEFKMMYFPRAWMSTGSAVRLVQMMGLNRLDGAVLDVKQCLPPPRDWTEREERRRTFWMAFNEDRYASIGTGWPMTIDERDIMTDLPASDEAFDMSRQETTHTLSEAMSPAGAAKLSSFGAICLMACLFGRNLVHLHRPDPDDRDDDLNGEFWKRHRNMDNILLNTSLSMPSHLKLPNGISNANIVFVNMNIHTSTICLHQAAIYKAEKNKLPPSISAESKMRCITAANEIAGIMRLISHLDLSAMNPFISFCLYVAARVFVQYLKSKPNDSQTGDSLRFLLSAMNAMKVKNPLTESFMVQLDVDLEGLGMRSQKYKSVFAYSDENVKHTAAQPAYLALTKMPGGAPRNECVIFNLGEDVAPTSPGGVQNVMHDGGRESDQQATGPESRDVRYSANGLSGWDSMNHTRHGQEVQRTLQSLALADTAQTSYGTGFSGGSNYVNSSSSNTGDSGLSPDAASNRPTPNSSTASDHRASFEASSKSYEASPVASDSRGAPPPDSRSMDPFFATQPNYSNIPSTGLTPGTEFSMPETPGRGFDIPPGWEMTGNTQTGLTPVGDGVFRQLMGLGPMDGMDIGWNGDSAT